LFSKRSLELLKIRRLVHPKRNAISACSAVLEHELVTQPSVMISSPLFSVGIAGEFDLVASVSLMARMTSGAQVPQQEAQTEHVALQPWSSIQALRRGDEEPPELVFAGRFVVLRAAVGKST
jgi:hypothetical protein